MLPVRQALLILAISLAACPLVHAGVYCTRERPLLPLPTSYEKGIKAVVGELRSLPLQTNPPPATPYLQEFYGVDYRQLLTQLEARKKEGMLSLLDHVDLGACYIRMQRFDEARLTLEEGLKKAPPEWSGRFLLYANLAAAHHYMHETLDGPGETRFLMQAILNEKSALKAWPRLWAGWQGEQLRSYQRIEQAYLRLLETRLAEARQPRMGNTLDPLFPGVRFVGPSGEYEAGLMAVDVWDKLPFDAPEVVWQLVLWRPDDYRLYWLLGEVLNARGRVHDAERILDELDDSLRYNTQGRELHHHRNVLREATLVATAWGQNPLTAHLVLAALVPRGMPVGMGVAPAFTEVVWPAFERIQKASEETVARPAVNGQPNQGVTGAIRREILPQWRFVLVGLGAGVLIGLLGFWQMQQWRRRLSSGVMERRLEEG